MYSKVAKKRFKPWQHTHDYADLLGCMTFGVGSVGHHLSLHFVCSQHCESSGNCMCPITNRDVSLEEAITQLNASLLAIT